jgi:hypothetical protein
MRVFSYGPANVYLIGNDEEVSLIEEYAMLGGRHDAVHSRLPFMTIRRCAVDDVTVTAFCR